MESVYLRRSTYSLIILGFILSVFLFTLSAVKQRQDIRQRAAAETTATLVANQTSVAPGVEIAFDVVLNTGNNQIAAVDINLSWDAAFFDIVSLTKGTLLPQEFPGGALGSGSARIILAAEPATPVQGTGVAAVLMLRARTGVSGQTTVRLDQSTMASAIGETGNVLTTLIPSTVTIDSTSAVSADTTIQINPQTISVNQNDIFSLPVQINTGTNVLAAADLTLVYDQTKLEGRTIKSGGFFPKELVAGTIDSGAARITLGADPGVPKQGTGLLVTIEFKALVGSGETTISFAPATQVAGLASSQNMLKSAQGAVVKLGTSSTASPSPATGGTQICVGAGSIPQTPYLTSATRVNDRQIDLVWNSVNNATQYGIVFGTGSRNYTFGAASVGNVTAYTVSGLSPNTTYYFAVFAVNECGSSNFSNELNRSTKNPLASGSTAIQPSPSAVSDSETVFRPINPDIQDPNEFVSPAPLVSVQPIPRVSVPEENAADAQTGAFDLFALLTPLRVAIGVLILLLILGFFLLRRKN